jgi:hypothetical protein
VIGRARTGAAAWAHGASRQRHARAARAPRVLHTLARRSATVPLIARRRPVGPHWLAERWARLGPALPLALAAAECPRWRRSAPCVDGVNRRPEHRWRRRVTRRGRRRVVGPRAGGRRSRGGRVDAHESSSGGNVRRSAARFTAFAALSSTLMAIAAVLTRITCSGRSRSASIRTALTLGPVGGAGVSGRSHWAPPGRRTRAPRPPGPRSCFCLVAAARLSVLRLAVCVRPSVRAGTAADQRAEHHLRADPRPRPSVDAELLLDELPVDGAPYDPPRWQVGGGRGSAPTLRHGASVLGSHIGYRVGDLS